MKRQDETEAMITMILCVALMFVFALLSSCANEEFGTNPLSKQIVRFRQGHKGPTHQVCSERNFWGTCLKHDDTEYDLTNIEVRRSFRTLGFICIVGGQPIGKSRFKIDDQTPQLVHLDVTNTCWLCNPQKVYTYFSFEKPQFLIDAGTVCYSENSYPNGVH